MLNFSHDFLPEKNDEKIISGSFMLLVGLNRGCYGLSKGLKNVEGLQIYFFSRVSV